MDFRLAFGLIHIHTHTHNIDLSIIVMTTYGTVLAYCTLKRGYAASKHDSDYSDCLSNQISYGNTQFVQRSTFHLYI